jgi:hypothetical protein
MWKGARCWVESLSACTVHHEPATTSNVCFRVCLHCTMIHAKMPAVCRQQYRNLLLQMAAA